MKRWRHPSHDAGPWETAAFAALVLFHLVHAGAVWIGYDNMREFWVAASWLVGGEVPWTGGTAAGFGFASPLTAWLIAAVLAVDPTEAAPGLVLSLALLTATVAAWWTGRNPLRRAALAVLLASPYYLILVRYGLDGSVLLALALVVTVLIWRWAEPTWPALVGTALVAALLPHGHASGIFLALGAAVLLVDRGRLRGGRAAAVVALCLSGLAYWLLPLEPAEGGGRPVGFLPDPIAAAARAMAVARGTLAVDRDFAEQWLPWATGAWAVALRLALSAWWLAVLVAANGRRSRRWTLPLAAGFVAILFFRADYVMAMQFAVPAALIVMTIDAHADHRRQTLARLGWVLVAAQLPATVALQHGATTTGAYTVPAAYFSLALPELATTPIRHAELTTAARRGELRAAWQRAHDEPLFATTAPVSEDAVIAAGSTGMLFLQDLWTYGGDRRAPPAAVAATAAALFNFARFEPWALTFAAHAWRPAGATTPPFDVPAGQGAVTVPTAAAFCLPNELVLRYFCDRHICRDVAGGLPATTRRGGHAVVCLRGPATLPPPPIRLWRWAETATQGHARMAE